MPRSAPAHPFAVPVTLVALAVLGALALSGASAAAAETSVEDGVRHVRNAAASAEGVRTLHATELWRAGGDDEDLFFGTVSRVLRDEAGTVWVLDSQLSEVHLFSPDGEYLETVGREGDGPGEFRLPPDMLFLPDGILGVVQFMPGRIVKLGPGGTPAGIWTAGGDDPTSGGFIQLSRAIRSGEDLVLGGRRVVPGRGSGSRTDFIARFSAAGTEICRYAERMTRRDPTNPTRVEKDLYFPTIHRVAVGPDGRVYAPLHRNRYAIDVWNADGTQAFVIERAFESRPRTARETAIAEASHSQVGRRRRRTVPVEIEPTEPDVNALHVDAAGALWVEHSRSAHDTPPGTLLTYDVFDADGTLARQVAVACPGDGTNDKLFLLGDDRAVLVTGFVEAAAAIRAGGALELRDGEEPLPMEVICYALAE